MTTPSRSRVVKAALCAFLVAAAAASASATRLRLDRAVLDFDPNQPMWHVSTHLCNTDQVPSGTLTYYIWLYKDDPSANGGKSNFINLGGATFKKVLQAGQCWDFKDTHIMVKTAKVPSGQFHMQLAVAEWDGSRNVTRVAQPFYMDDGTYQDLLKN